MQKNGRFRHGMLIYRKKWSIVWTYLLILKEIIMSNLEIVFTLCIPILLVGLGMGMKTKTPQKNRWIGWRTPAAMKNETIFKKANIYAGKIMFRYGC